MNDLRQPSLVAESCAIPPGGEWAPQACGWRLVYVESGEAYSLAETNHQLAAGSLLRISPLWTGRIRASQLGSLKLLAVRIDPLRLTGLVSIGEGKFFAAAAAHPDFALTVWPGSHPLAAEARECFSPAGSGLSFRLRVLQIFAASWENATLPSDQAEPPKDAAERLHRLLQELPTADLIQLSVRDLAARLCCTPRHFSRIFRELVGVSFRQKQTEIRLDHAVQLLARTDSKVVDVAFESGFGSVSLFNTLFKRRYRLAPREWRAKAQRQSPTARPRFSSLKRAA